MTSSSRVSFYFFLPLPFSFFPLSFYNDFKRDVISFQLSLNIHVFNCDTFLLFNSFLSLNPFHKAWIRVAASLAFLIAISRC